LPGISGPKRYGDLFGLELWASKVKMATNVKVVDDPPFYKTL